MDEKGVLHGCSGSSRIVVFKRKILRTSHSGNREFSTVVECVSMGGLSTPSWIVMRGKQLQRGWFDVIADGVNFAVNDNGWIDNELSLAWLQKCFDPYTRSVQKGSKRMLIVDGHNSHVSSKIIEFCVQNGIELVCLPPHTTQHLQPLDVGLFGPLGQRYKNSITDKARIGAGYHIDKIDFLRLYR